MTNRPPLCACACIAGKPMSAASAKADDQCALRVWLDGAQIYPAVDGIPLLRTPSEPTTAVNPSSGFVDHETITSGHWALVPGLDRGLHSLRFAGQWRGSDGQCGSPDGFTVDVTYDLDVGGAHH